MVNLDQQMSGPQRPIESDRVSTLRARFGELLSLRDVAELLRYPSLRAIQQARRRGTLGIPFVRIVGRRGWFATVRGVASYLDALETKAARTSEHS